MLVALLWRFAALSGDLFRYQTRALEPRYKERVLQAFESPIRHGHTRFAIYVGGLEDGFLAQDYVEQLAAECDRLGWGFVQPLLSSSYRGFGISSLARDVSEMSDLLSHLVSYRDARTFAIVGFAAGCNIAVHLLAKSPPQLRKMIRAVVLQAPISSREMSSITDDEVMRNVLLTEANRLVLEGNGGVLLPGLHHGVAPITARRYTSLIGRGGPDDVFSSDFSDRELAARLGHMSTVGQHEARGMASEALPEHPGLRVLFVLSLADEFVPDHINQRELSWRFVRACGSADSQEVGSLLIEHASHSLREQRREQEEGGPFAPQSAAQKFVDAVGIELILALDPKAAKTPFSRERLARQGGLGWAALRAGATRSSGDRWMEGSLYRYRLEQPQLQAFESPLGPRRDGRNPRLSAHTRFAIFVGGLSDGLLGCQYVEQLAAELDRKGWAFVQPVLSSSYGGYGTSSLAQDAAELTQLLTTLYMNREVSAFAIIGHATGCQSAVHLLAKAPAYLRQLIRAVVLQAPVSEREAAVLGGNEHGRVSLLNEAHRLIDEGRPEALMPTLHLGWVPITASRWLSLFGHGGPDDLFSSDLSDRRVLRP